MKIFISSLFIVLSYQYSYTQIKEWQTYDLDSIVYLDMPNVVYETDTIIDYKKYYQISSNIDSSLFIAQKHYLGQLYNNIQVQKLPINKKRLQEYYLEIIWSFDEVTPFKMDEFKAIEFNNLEAFEVFFIDKKGKRVQKLVLFLMNKHLYFFSYINENGLDNSEINTFFNSISLEKGFTITQYPRKSHFSFRNILITLMIILFISFLLRMKAKPKKQDNFL